MNVPFINLIKIYTRRETSNSGAIIGLNVISKSVRRNIITLSYVPRLIKIFKLKQRASSLHRDKLSLCRIKIGRAIPTVTARNPGLSQNTPQARKLWPNFAQPKFNQDLVSFKLSSPLPPFHSFNLRPYESILTKFATKELRGESLHRSLPPSTRYKTF